MRPRSVEVNRYGDPILRFVTELISEWRNTDEYGHSIQGLAERVGISYIAAYNIAHGRTKNPKFMFVVWILDMFGYELKVVKKKERNQK